MYTGYAKALEPLIRFMVDPESRSEMYGVQLHVCMQLVRAFIRPAFYMSYKILRLFIYAGYWLYSKHKALTPIVVHTTQLSSLWSRRSSVSCSSLAAGLVAADFLLFLGIVWSS